MSERLLAAAAISAAIAVAIATATAAVDVAAAVVVVAVVVVVVVVVVVLLLLSRISRPTSANLGRTARQKHHWHVGELGAHDVANLPA